MFFLFHVQCVRRDGEVGVPNPLSPCWSASFPSTPSQCCRTSSTNATATRWRLSNGSSNLRLHPLTSQRRNWSRRWDDHHRHHHRVRRLLLCKVRFPLFTGELNILDQPAHEKFRNLSEYFDQKNFFFIKNCSKN